MRVLLAVLLLALMATPAKADWGPLQTLSTEHGEAAASARGPDFDVAAWAQHNVHGRSIHVARRSGTRFRHAITVRSGAGAVRGLNAAVDQNGTVVIGWEESSATAWLAAIDRGGHVTIDPLGTGSAPRVVAIDGRIAAVWTVVAPPVPARTVLTLGTPGHDTLVPEPIDGITYRDLTVAAGPRGSLVIGTQRRAGFACSLDVKTRAASGAWTTEPIRYDAECDSGIPIVLGGATGTRAVWTHYSFNEQTWIEAVRRPAAARGFGAPQRLSPTTKCCDVGPEVDARAAAQSPRGRAAALFSQDATLRLALAAPGQPFAHALKVTDHDWDRSPTVAVSDRGDAIVLWRHAGRRRHQQLLARVVDRRGRLSRRQTVADAAPRYDRAVVTSAPALGPSHDGGVVSVFQDVYGRTYARVWRR